MVHQQDHYEKNQADIWVLTDHRTGNSNQAVALAEATKKSFLLKPLSYNIFVYLPEWFLYLMPICLRRGVLESLKSTRPPKMIISAGRRTSIISLFLKNFYGKTGNDVKLVQIMRPAGSYNKFDLIILPEHDKFPAMDNVIRVIGAVTNTYLKIEKMLPAFDQNYPKINKCIAIVVGGVGSKQEISLSQLQSFASIAHRIASNYNLMIIITFSRRTPEQIKLCFKEIFTSQNGVLANKTLFFDPSLPHEYNPYPAMLARAEYILCTGDSISMCTEAVSTGRPVYIFWPSSHHVGSKHDFFVQQLFDLELARKIENDTNILESYSYPPLNELKKILSKITKLLE